MRRSLLAQSIRAICVLGLAETIAPQLLLAADAEKPVVLDKMVVEGDRLQVLPTDPVESVFGFGKNVYETPRSVTSISSEMLDRVIITELDDLVALTPGSFTQSFFGVAGSLDVRGTPGENYFRGIKRIDNPGNYPTPIGASDRIDVVRGPASPIYGPSKIGGYLNFVPKSARASSGQFLTEATGEVGLTLGSWDKKVVHAEVGGPANIGSKPMGYYLYTEFENSGSYYENSSTDQAIVQASFDLNLSDTTRFEFGGMYQDFKGNQVAGWNRLSQNLINNGTYVTGSPTSRDTNGDGLMSPAESNAGSGLTAFLFGPQTPASITAALTGNPNLNLVNPGTAHLDGSQVLVQDDDTLEDQVVTLYFDSIFELSSAFKITNKMFYESLDNLNENAYGFSQMANTFVFEDQLIFAFSTDRHGFFQGNFQVSPSIRHQDFEHGDNFANEYFDRRDLTKPGSPIDRRTMATRGQELYSSHTVGSFTDTALAGLVDITLFDSLNVLGGARYDSIDMQSQELKDSIGGGTPEYVDQDKATSWSVSVSYQLPFGIRPYITKAQQSTLILGQGGQIPADLVNTGDAIGDSELEEFGIKANLLGNKLYLALDYFDQKRVDYNAQDVVTNNTTQAKGYEFEGRWVATDHLTLTSAYTNLKIYNLGALNSQFQDQFGFVGASDLQGVNPALLYGGVGLSTSPVKTMDQARKAGIPENVFSAYAIVSFDGALSGMTASLGATHVDSVFSGFSKTVTLPAYTLVNASIYYEMKNWKLGLQGKNLTDERYFRSNFPDLFGSTVVLPELPRNFLLSASYKF